MPQKTCKTNVKSKRQRKRPPALNVHKENAKLCLKVKSLARKLQRLKSHKPKLRKEDTVDQAAQYLNDDVLAFIKMQLNHDKQRNWEKDEKQFALGLYYKSPKAYVYLRDYKHFFFCRQFR